MIFQGITKGIEKGDNNKNRYCQNLYEKIRIRVGVNLFTRFRDYVTARRAGKSAPTQGELLIL